MFLSKGYKNIYYLYFEHPVTGKQTRKSTKEVTKAGANKFLQHFKEEQILEQKYPLLTLSDLKDRFMTYVQNHQAVNTVKSYNRAISNLISVIGDKQLKILTISDFEKYKKVRLSTINKVSCNIELRSIKACFGYAVKQNLLKETPTRGLEMFKIPEKEKQCLSSDEITKVLDTIANKNFKDLIQFAIFTGCRLSEVLSVQMKDIDIKGRLVNIRNKERLTDGFDFKTKSGKVRVVPINAELMNIILPRLTENTNGLLFPNKIGIRYDISYISNQFKKHLRSAQLPEKFHFHSLRHGYITTLIKNGMNLNFVKEIAGHQDIKTTMGYVHLAPEDLKNAISNIKFF